MSNNVRTDMYLNQGKFKVYADVSRDSVLPLLCESSDKKFYWKFSYFNKCFNCRHFSSLTSYLDFCTRSGFIRNFDDKPCEDFLPIKYSWFYRDFKKE